MISKKWFVIPVILLALWSCYVINFNLVRHSGYYAQHLPHKKGTNPELIFTLKHLYYLEKPNDSSLRYDYDGTSAIIVDGDFFITSYKGPILMTSKSDNGSTSYEFDTESYVTDFILSLQRSRS